jgi:hypothetical protein
VVTVGASYDALVLVYLIPVFVLGGLALLLGILALLARVKGGRYLRPIVQWLMKVPLVGRGLKKMSEAALERSDPELASAVKKLERMGANRDPRRAQQAMSQLSAAERKAVMEATLGHEEAPMPMNRAQRRKLEQQRKAKRG